MKSPIHTINYKFCSSLPICLQTCNCRMYYVVYKFPNLSIVMIHLGIHSHPVIDGMCRESFQDMKNMVVDEVCCTSTFTSLVIALSTSKTFLSRHLFNEDGISLVKFLKGEKLNQTSLKFAPLCSPDYVIKTSSR